MPSLLIFAPCEKVIIDQDNNVSLIGVLNGLQIQVPQNPNAARPRGMAAYKWEVVTYWDIKPEDRGKRFEQHIKLFGPDGEPTKIEATAAVQTNAQNHRITTTVWGFPILEPGRYVLKLYFQEAHSVEPAPENFLMFRFMTPVAEYPIAVTYETK